MKHFVNYLFYATGALLATVVGMMFLAGLVVSATHAFSISFLVGVLWMTIEVLLCTILCLKYIKANKPPGIDVDDTGSSHMGGN